MSFTNTTHVELYISQKSEHFSLQCSKHSNNLENDMKIFFTTCVPVHFLFVNTNATTYSNVLQNTALYQNYALHLLRKQLTEPEISITRGYLLYP